MREAGIGRVLVASIHQGIADILPMRLGFYENWLNAEGLREGTIGLGPLYAVLSFLRREGEAYDRITTRAGEYAAEWTVESMAPILRGAIRAAPARLRQRLLLLLAGHLVRDSCRRSRIVVKCAAARPGSICASRSSVPCGSRRASPSAGSTRRRSPGC
jgi:hypothetical protein